MEEKEFLLELDKKLVSEYYDKRLVLDILNIIKDYYNADACSYDMNEITNDIVMTSPNTTDGIKIGNITIYNPQKEINSYMDVFLTIFSKNLMQFCKLWQKSHIDDLTNVYNYNSLCEKLKSFKEANNVGVAFIDANGLGLINNTQGHEEGDKLLKTIAIVTSKVFRQREIYRKGGDEFIILCNDISKEFFNKKLNEIRELITLTPYTISMGSAYAEKVENIEELIKEADVEMYKEKEEYKAKNPNKYGIKK